MLSRRAVAEPDHRDDDDGTAIRSTTVDGNDLRVTARPRSNRGIVVIIGLSVGRADRDAAAGSSLIELIIGIVAVGVAIGGDDGRRAVQPA